MPRRIISPTRIWNPDHLVSIPGQTGCKCNPASCRISTNWDRWQAGLRPFNTGSRTVLAVVSPGAKINAAVVHWRKAQHTFLLHWWILWEVREKEHIFSHLVKRRKRNLFWGNVHYNGVLQIGFSENIPKGNFCPWTVTRWTLEFYLISHIYNSRRAPTSAFSINVAAMWWSV